MSSRGKHGQTNRNRIEAFAGSHANEEALDIYMAKEYPDLGTLVPRDRQAGKNLRTGDMEASAAGWSAGRQAQLNYGVDNTPLAIGQ